MKCVIYNSIPHILSRTHTSRGVLELVNISTCETIFVPLGENTVKTYDNEPPTRQTYPGNVEFFQRAPDFITELQQRRKDFLREAQELKRKTTGPRKGSDTSNSDGRGSGKKGSRKKLDPIAEMQRMMQEKILNMKKEPQ